jgi:hypothetical protein
LTNQTFPFDESKVSFNESNVSFRESIVSFIACNQLKNNRLQAPQIEQITQISQVVIRARESFQNSVANSGRKTKANKTP